MLESNELTEAESRLHDSLKDIADKIAELAHCGEKYFMFEDLMERVDLDVNDIMQCSDFTLLTAQCSVLTMR